MVKDNLVNRVEIIKSNYNNNGDLIKDLFNQLNILWKNNNICVIYETLDKKNYIIEYSSYNNPAEPKNFWLFPDEFKLIEQEREKAIKEYYLSLQQMDDCEDDINDNCMLFNVKDKDFKS